MILAEDVSLIYEDHGGQVYACQDMSIAIHPGEFVGILGPSGSGKSSLLYLLSGLKQPTAGRITVDGEDLASLTDENRATMRLKQFGFIFQYPYLLGYLTALENVLVARPGEDRQQEAEALLTDLGLGAKMKRLPHELSGGEKQRVCVARALLGSPTVIFADEPTAALDHRNGHQVVDLLNDHRGSGALVMVTHDAEMLADADRIVMIEDGRIASTAIAN